MSAAISSAVCRLSRCMSARIWRSKSSSAVIVNSCVMKANAARILRGPPDHCKSAALWRARFRQTGCVLPGGERLMRRLLLLMLVVIAGGAGLVYWRFDDAVALLFQYQPPKVDETKLTDEAEGRRRDAAYFAAYTRYDRSYSAE